MIYKGCGDVHMNELVKEYIGKYPSEIIEMFYSLRQMILDSAPREPEETMWAKMPSFYVGKNFVRLIPFKDHINIEARTIIEHREELPGYKISPKGMLQIFTNQQIPREVLMRVFKETLTRPTGNDE